MSQRISLPKNKWSSDEDALLIEMYADPSLKNTDIAKALNRTSASVYNRAKTLKIKKVTYSTVEVPEGMKICRKCGIIKDISLFKKNRTKHDGCDCWCSECSKEYKNQRLLKIAQQKIENINIAKEQFILENQDKLFKCTHCGEEYDINQYVILKKKTKFSRESICKKCKVAKHIEWKYNKIKSLGHI